MGLQIKVIGISQFNAIRPLDVDYWEPRAPLPCSLNPGAICVVCQRPVVHFFQYPSREQEDVRGLLSIKDHVRLCCQHGCFSERVEGKIANLGCLLLDLAKFNPLQAELIAAIEKDFGVHDLELDDNTDLELGTRVPSEILAD